jgi:hypothetical protein
VTDHDDAARAGRRARRRGGLPSRSEHAPRVDAAGDDEGEAPEREQAHDQDVHLLIMA